MGERRGLVGAFTLKEMLAAPCLDRKCRYCGERDMNEGDQCRRCGANMETMEEYYRRCLAARKRKTGKQN